MSHGAMPPSFVCMYRVILLAGTLSLPVNSMRWTTTLRFSRMRNTSSTWSSVTQVISGSTGLDDFEWGVTLFAKSPDVIKEVVYTMRFDEGSALYGEFGAFYVGYLEFIENII